MFYMATAETLTAGAIERACAKLASHGVTDPMYLHMSSTLEAEQVGRELLFVPFCPIDYYDDGTLWMIRE